MFVIVGLGNPGVEYAGDRHNVGFMALDAIAEQHHFSFLKNKKFSADAAEGIIKQHKTMLLKPLTFMNLSGRSVSAVMNFLKLENENFLIIHDDIDLPFLTLRASKGGAAGHRGVMDILERGYSGMFRLRIGVGRPTKLSVSDYVLSKFSSEEKKLLASLFRNIADNIHLLCSKPNLLNNFCCHHNASLEKN